MNDKGIRIPMPRKESDVSINQMSGAGISFNIFAAVNEYITVSEAAKIRGITKEQMRQLVDERGIEKYEESDNRYLLLKSDIENL